MSSIEEGIGPTIYTYTGLNNLEETMKMTRRSIVRLYMSQTDQIVLLEDIQNNYDTFKYFSVMSVNDYFEYEDGKEVYGNSIVRNESKFVFGDKILEIEVYDTNG